MSPLEAPPTAEQRRRSHCHSVPNLRSIASPASSSSSSLLPPSPTQSVKFFTHHGRVGDNNSNSVSNGSCCNQSSGPEDANNVASEHRPPSRTGTKRRGRQQQHPQPNRWHRYPLFFVSARRTHVSTPVAVLCLLWLLLVLAGYTEFCLWNRSSAWWDDHNYGAALQVQNVFGGSSSSNTTLLPSLSRSRIPNFSKLPGSPANATSTPGSDPITSLSAGSDTSSVGGNDGAAAEEVGPLVHIIHSRFMQHQPNLIHLGEARLRLFQYFFLNSLRAQSSTNFICVVRTDPQLDPSLKQSLIDRLQQSQLPHLLIASNDLPKSQYQEIVNGIVKPSMVWSGDLDAIKAYLGVQKGLADEKVSAQVGADGGPSLARLAPDSKQISSNGRNDDKNFSSGKPSLSLHPRVLETRLDADDALHRVFVETLQAEAVGRELPLSVTHGDDRKHDAAGNYAYDFAPLTWRMWCVDSHAEWQYQSAWKDPTPKEIEEDAGSIISLAVAHCVTPGLSIAFLGQDKSIDTMPSTSKHEKLMQTPPCTARPMDVRLGKGHLRFRSGSLGANVTSNCRSFVPMAIAALRARTPTSAGMLNIVYNGNSLNQKYVPGATKQRDVQDKVWYAIKRIFGFSKHHARSINRHMRDHMKAIAEENLMGQCTQGHSCKNSSQTILRSILDGAPS